MSTKIKVPRRDISFDDKDFVSAFQELIKPANQEGYSHVRLGAKHRWMAESKPDKFEHR